MKYTLELIKLFTQKTEPNLIIKFIYLHVYELMEETRCETVEQFQIISNLKHAYDGYFMRTLFSTELWHNTILPIKMSGYKNFYRGIAGRLAFFSVDLDAVIEDMKDANERLKYELLAQTPDTYYWYGNPRNWSYCYDARVVSEREEEGEKRFLLEKTKKFIITDNEFNIYEEMRDGNPYAMDVSQLLILYKQVNSSERLTKPYPYPTRRYHISDEETVENMIKSYEKNVNGKRGCDFLLSNFMGHRYDNEDKKQQKMIGFLRTDYINSLEEVEIRKKQIAETFAEE